MADNNKRYYWLKLKEDFFGDKTIKKLRRIAGGDTYTVIYLKMLLKSLRDDGKLYYEGIESDFASELALDIDEDEENVKVTIQFLMSYGLLEQINEEEFVLAKCAELTGNECYSAERMRNLRNRKKIASQCDTHVTTSDASVTTSDTNVIACDEEIEIEKEIEKEIELDKEIENRDRVSSNGKTVTPYADIVNLYNSICLSYPKVTTISDRRKQALKARLNKYTLDDFKKMFELAEASDFLKGSNNRDWSANFDWLIKDSNMAKVLDGNYNNYTRKNGNRKEEVQNNGTEQQQCNTDEQRKREQMEHDLDYLVEWGETRESLKAQLGNEYPDWYDAHYEAKYGNKEIQM